jgi:hypothetical protein
MSIEHLDTLHTELPELFQDRELAPFWDDDLIIVRVDDPEYVTVGEEQAIHLEPISEAHAKPRTDNIEELAMGSILPGAPFPELSPIILDVLGGAHGGGPIPYDDRNKMPPPDCLAFYLPFHYYHPTWWGVYLLLEGVVWLAGEIVKRSGGKVSHRRAIQAARLFLYHHEAFHHKTECFATRLELTHRKPFYKTGFERLYQKKFNTVDCLEEGLANASALIDTHEKLKDPSVKPALEGYVLESPPGYNQGVRIRGNFLPVRCAFSEENQQICLPHLPPKNPEVWGAAPHLFDGIANIKSRVNYVVPRTSPLAARLPFRPLLPPSKVQSSKQ